MFVYRRYPSLLAGKLTGLVPEVCDMKPRLSDSMFLRLLVEILLNPHGVDSLFHLICCVSYKKHHMDMLTRLLTCLIDCLLSFIVFLIVTFYIVLADMLAFS